MAINVSTIKKLFSIKEWAVLTSSTVISAVIISSIFWAPLTQGVEVEYAVIGQDVAIKNYLGQSLQPFYTYFFALYEQNASTQDKQKVNEIIHTHLPRLHYYADRNHLFYKDPQVPSQGFVQNLLLLNDHYGQEDFLTIDQDFYDLLVLAKSMMTLTQGRFNPFLGAVIDFWDDILDHPLYPLQYREMDPTFHPLVRRELEYRLSFVPLTESEMNTILELQDIDGQYQVRFNRFKDAPKGLVKISLGAIAKGFANDILAQYFAEEGLTRGYLFNGGSTISSLGPRYRNRPYAWAVESPIMQFERAFTIVKPGKHQLSTSGAYQGWRIRVGSQIQLRHHIINPLTGYPTQQAVELNVISSSYGAGPLDALSTAMMTMDISQALALRQTIMNLGYDLEFSWIEVNGNQLLVRYTEGYQAILEEEPGVQYAILPNIM